MPRATTGNEAAPAAERRRPGPGHGLAGLGRVSLHRVSLHRIGPVGPALMGAAFISSSAVLMRLAGTAAGTTAFYRCALALPGLAVAPGAKVGTMASCLSALRFAFRMRGAPATRPGLGSGCLGGYPPYPRRVAPG